MKFFWVSFIGANVILRSANEFTPGIIGGVRITHIFSFFVVLLCVFAVLFLWCPLRFPHKNHVRYVFTFGCLYKGSCLIYVVCDCLRIAVSNTYCAAIFVCLSSSCVLCTQYCQLLWIAHSCFEPSVFSNISLHYRHIWQWRQYLLSHSQSMTLKHNQMRKWCNNPMLPLNWYNPGRFFFQWL